MANATRMHPKIDPSAHSDSWTGIASLNIPCVNGDSLAVLANGDARKDGRAAAQAFQLCRAKAQESATKRRKHLSYAED
jgi:hypothetical protein